MKFKDISLWLTLSLRVNQRILHRSIILSLVMCTNCVNFIWVLEITQKLPSHFLKGRTIYRWLYCLSRVKVKICCGAVTSIIYLYLTSHLTPTAVFVALLCGTINLHRIFSENLGLVTSCGLACQFIELVVVSWLANIVARFFFSWG